MPSTLSATTLKILALSRGEYMGKSCFSRHFFFLAFYNRNVLSFHVFTMPITMFLSNTHGLCKHYIIYFLLPQNVRYVDTILYFSGPSTGISQIYSKC